MRHCEEELTIMDAITQIEKTAKQDQLETAERTAEQLAQKTRRNADFDQEVSDAEYDCARQKNL